MNTNQRNSSTRETKITTPTYFIKGDVSGIHEFIFNVKSEKAARVLKARSVFFFYNSMALLPYHWKDEENKNDRYNPFQKYCKLFFIGRDGQRNVPLTRTLSKKGLPLGWVKLKLLK